MSKTTKNLFRRATGKLHIDRPRNAELFTGRKRELEQLEQIVAPSPRLIPECTFLTQYYGMGGVGKSSLKAQAYALAKRYTNVTVIELDFDHNASGIAWSTQSSGLSVLREFISAASERGIKMPLSAALLLIVDIQTHHPASYQAPQEALGVVLDALDKGAEIAENIPGVGVALKVLKLAEDWWEKRNIRKELEDLDLWPGKRTDPNHFQKCEALITEAICHDICRPLLEDPNQHLRLIFDGFERIQSQSDTYETHYDAQKRVENLLFTLSQVEDASLLTRLRVLIFGRHAIRWDAVYRRPEWQRMWALHALEGLSREECRELISKHARWFSEQGHKAKSEKLLLYSERVITSATNSHGNDDSFLPFWINLAVDLVAESESKNILDELGNCPADLFKRFSKEIDPALLRTLRVLSLAERFDEALYNWLAEKRVVSTPVGGIAEALRLNYYCFYDRSNEGDFGFHGLFLHALQKTWFESADTRDDGRVVARKLLEYFAAPFKGKQSCEWDEYGDHWSKGVELLISLGPEKGLLDDEEWRPLLWSHPYCSPDCEPPENYLLRVLKRDEERLGLAHPSTLDTLSRFLDHGLDHPEEAIRFIRLKIAEAKATVDSNPHLRDLLASKLAYNLSLDADCSVMHEDNCPPYIFDFWVNAKEEAAALYRSVLRTAPGRENTLVDAKWTHYFLGKLLLEFDYSEDRVYEGLQHLLLCLGMCQSEDSRDHPMVANAINLAWTPTSQYAGKRLSRFRKDLIIQLERLKGMDGLYERIRYTLARYECDRGNLDEARRLIAQEIATKGGRKEQALFDPELVAIRDYIRGLSP